MAASGLAYEPDEVVVTCGATEALAATFAALLNPGDEVAILTPAFGLYESLALMNHAVPVPVDTEPHGFQIDEAALRRRISPATKAIVLCSPGNPTGCVLSTGSLDAIARLASETGIYVVCDDVYNRLVYTGGYARLRGAPRRAARPHRRGRQLLQAVGDDGVALGMGRRVRRRRVGDRQGPPVHGLLRPRVRDACG